MLIFIGKNPKRLGIHPIEKFSLKDMRLSNPKIFLRARLKIGTAPLCFYNGVIIF